MLTQEGLKELLSYNQMTGIFYWLNTGKGRRVNRIAGHVESNGYIRICIDFQKYSVHRLVWLYMYGEFPSDQIDHKDHDKQNNRIDNLRAVNGQENSKNQPIAVNNKSGTTGVCWNKRCNKWMSYIYVNSKCIHLGYFDNKVCAVAARKSAEIEYGFHPNHGEG